jgi:hypothetical protein
LIDLALVGEYAIPTPATPDNPAIARVEWNNVLTAVSGQVHRQSLALNEPASARSRGPLVPREPTEAEVGLRKKGDISRRPSGPGSSSLQVDVPTAVSFAIGFSPSTDNLADAKEEGGMSKD